MARCAVDASVVVKWFLDEEFSADARRLRNDHLSDTISAEAPAVLPFEVLNAARVSGALRKDEMLRIAEALDQAAVPLHALAGPLAARTIELAETTGLTVYDASYGAVAQAMGVPLYTADEQMLRAGPPLGDVRHIRSYPNRD